MKKCVQNINANDTGMINKVIKLKKKSINNN